ncbi:MAG: hypothetical protein ACFCA4_04205 [Cyanophyceae cyanobacterium]
MGVDWDILKTHFLQADPAVQLDSLALNLTRIQVFANSGTGESVAQHLVRESQFFIEWMVVDINLESDAARAAELVDLQRVLSRWKLSWRDWWEDEQKREEMANLAQRWSDRLLQEYALSA